METLERGFAMKISQGLIVAGEDDSIFHVASLMKKHNIGAVLIIRGDDLVGIISERDITTRVVSERLDPNTTFAKDIMTRELITANMEDGLNGIYEMLASVPFRHLPILKDKKLAGIVSKRDILFSLKPRI